MHSRPWILGENHDAACRMYTDPRLSSKYRTYKHFPRYHDPESPRSGNPETANGSSAKGPFEFGFPFWRLVSLVSFSISGIELSLCPECASLALYEFHFSIGGMIKLVHL